MKTLRPLVVAFSLLLVVSAAKAQQPVLRADIPFNFVVGNRALPAGEYTLSTVLTGSNVIAVRDWDEPGRVSIANTTPCSVKEPAKTSKLVFHRMGNEYFLYQIWVEGNSAGREFPKSKMEIQMAKNHVDADEIIVAALITQ